MGSESTKIVAFQVVLDAYHVGMHLPRAVESFVLEMQKLGAEVTHSRGYVSSWSQISVELHVELPGGTLLNCNRVVTFSDLIKTDYRASDNAQAITQLLIDGMGVYVTDGIGEALEAKQFSYHPLDAYFKGFRIVLKAPSGCDASADADLLERSIRDVIDTTHWSYEPIDEGEPFAGPLTRIVDIKPPIEYDSAYAYAPTGVEFSGFPVLLKSGLADDIAVLGRAAKVLREVVRSSQLDWGLSD